MCKNFYGGLLLFIVSLFSFLTFLPLCDAEAATAVVKLLYFRPNDRAAIPDIDTKIITLIKEVQDFYADEMERHGYGRKTFTFETDADGKAIVVHGIGQHHEAHYDGFGKIYDELWNNYIRPNAIYFIVIDVRTDNPFSGLATLGNAAYIPIFGHSFNAAIAAHELGHAFGLAHLWTPGYLMARGDGRELSPCSAAFLDAIVYFNPDMTIVRNQNTTVAAPRLSVAPDAAFRLEFDVADPDGIRHVQLKIPTVERQYFGTFIDSCAAVEAQHDTVAFLTTGVSERNSVVELLVIDTFGNVTEHAFRVDVAAVLPAEVVEIPDENLATVIREVLYLPPNRPITTYEMRDITMLYAENRQISDLTGLQHALNMGRLYASNNAITDVSPLVDLKKLTELSLDNNAITDVSRFAEMTQLTELSLIGNTISDRTPLLALLRRQPDVEIYLKYWGVPLPVTLSYFRAEHTDAGVVLKWTTESERNNAGFYILRSNTQTGEFQQGTARLIPGAGTTSERNFYTWTDTTAKPNTVYYYRITDVSYDGKHGRLATTRLRGFIAAKDKWIGQWAALKDLQ